VNAVVKHPNSMNIDPQEFYQQGFVVARKLCEPDVLESMRQKTLADLGQSNGPVEFEADVGYDGAPESRQQPGGQTIRRLLGALERGPVFQQWASAGAVVRVVRKLFQAGSDGRGRSPGPVTTNEQLLVVRAHHNCIMTKHPDFSSSTGWHKDTRYWAYERPDLINAWTALGIESEDNGGMQLIPGSHRHAFKAACFDSAKFFRQDYPPNQAWLDRAVQVDMQPGDVLFFHARLLHAAGQNRSMQRKLSVVFSYRTSSNMPIPGTRSSSLEDMVVGRLNTGQQS